MDLLLVTGRFPQRSETFIYRKAVSLARAGHRVTLATRGIGDWSIYPDPLPETLSILQLPRELADMESLRSLARATLHARGELREEYERCLDLAPSRREGLRLFLRHAPLVGLRPDVAHFEFLGLAAMYPHARALLKAPVIASCRGQDVHLLPIRADATAELACLRTVDAVHCVTDELARCVAALGRRERVHVNRAAVDVAEILERAPLRHAVPRIVATGRLTWVKGFDYLLAALARVARRGVPFTAEIIGDGELRTALRFAIDDLGLRERVTLVGALSSAEVLARLQRADLFVLSSHAEGISNGALEAMASGVPLVTTEAGGMREAVTDGVEGFVVPIRDADALAERIAQLLEDAPARERMGHAARARAVAEFTIERQIAGFEAIYRAVIGAPS